MKWRPAINQIESQQCGDWENWTDMCTKMKLNHLLTPHTRIQLKWIKDLNFRPETIKILEGNIGSKSLDIAHSNFLLDISPQAREPKEKKNKQMGFHQTKTILPSKGNHRQSKKTTHRMGEHIHQYIW